LGRFGQATVGLPGGCDLGPRPTDLHDKAFKALGAKKIQEEEAEHLEVIGDSLVGTTIYMDVVSVGATINTMLAASRAKGLTIIENAAREPEIIDVATLLNNMGAQVRGAGTDIIRITGVDEMHGAQHTVIPDRIEAGTYLALAAAMGDGVIIENVIYEHLESFIAKLEEMGVGLTIREDSIEVHKSENLKSVNITSVPYPGFATDLQQPITPLLLKAKGRGSIVDTIYQKRVNHVPELARMGANISVLDDRIIYDAPNELTGSCVQATDLRAGAALVTAGIIASGTTKISNIEFILRGYDHIIEKLTAVGVDIQLIEE
jgi:UDP-N-acetylglucosamine 1-carboxyvinyltransferase